MNFVCQPVVITAAVARSALGNDLAAALEKILGAETGLRPYAEFAGLSDHYPGLFAGWLSDRSPMKGRIYGAASNLAIVVAKDVIRQAGWTTNQSAEAWLFGGSSRANTCELLAETHGRRPMSKYAASNSMHSETLASVSIECGIHGPWNMLSNGCSSGLDAVIWAAHAVATGLAPRAVVVSVELPLLPKLLRDFHQTGLLNNNGTNDPYSPRTSGFHPGEAAVALTIEPRGMGPQITGAWMNADAYDPVGLPADGHGIFPILSEAWRTAQAASGGRDPAVCPHASGTHAHGMAEQTALRELISTGLCQQVEAHLLKPFTGHTLGASGALDVAILHTFITEGILPPNLPGLAVSGPGILLPDHARLVNERMILKISVGMGGHNAIVCLKAPSPL